MLGVLLAFVLIAVLRNGMQLANIGGATQDIVIGGLLARERFSPATLMRAVAGRGLPSRRRRQPSKGGDGHGERPRVSSQVETCKTRQGGRMSR